MKVSLSVKISIKDIFPKSAKIPFEKFICLLTYNNFSGKINLKNLSNNNSIKHKTDIYNSNIIYNVNIIDSNNNNSLIGISQLIIYFDKIKNLNINDTLTQEEKIRIIIDSKMKRKIFEKIYNIGEIYLIFLTEIKIIDKTLFIPEDKNTSIFQEEKEFISNNNIFEFNTTPRNSKKSKKIKSIKKDRETIKRIDTFSYYNDLNLADYLSDESIKNTTTTSLLPKTKSLQKITKHAVDKKNRIFLNNINNPQKTRHRVINSCFEFPYPCSNNTNYNFNTKKNGKKKKLIPKSINRNEIPKKKVTILNLMEEKMNPLLYRQTELNNTNINFSKDFKNTTVNFSKSQINKINNNLKKYSSRTLTRHKSTNLKDKMKYNKFYSRDDKLEYSNSQKKTFIKNNSTKSKNAIQVNLNQNQLNKEIKTISTISNDKNEKEKVIKNKDNKIIAKKLSLTNSGRLNTDMNFQKNINTNFYNTILKTEIYNRNDSEMKINLKKGRKKNILTDLDLEQLIIEKGAYIKGNFQNKYIKDKRRGAFSPKLSIKFKFNDNTLKNYNDLTDSKLQKEKRSSRYNYTKLLTPKGNPRKLNSFAYNIANGDNNSVEKEEIAKKFINLIDFYSLLSKKLKKNNKNNEEFLKKFEKIKEKYNFIRKQKNRLIQNINYSQSNKLKNKAIFRIEQEDLLNKMMNIKLQEKSVYQNIFGIGYGDEEMQNKIELLMSEKKEMMLNLIKNIVKFYGNISQIFNDDKKKKDKLKALLNKYSIKEKIKIDLNYISHIHKENNFEDKIITEVDEEKENEEDEEEIKQQNNNQIKNNELQNKNDNNENINNNVESLNVLINNENNINYIYDENLNNLIKKILIEQFPKNYKTNTKFNYLDKNRYAFGKKIFLGYIENNDIILREEINENNISSSKYRLNEFYNKYCSSDKKEKKSNFIYTKKIRQKYIKIKNNDKEQSTDKKPKNESSTTMSDNEKKTQSFLSKLNEMGEVKSITSGDEKEII